MNNLQRISAKEAFGVATPIGGADLWSLFLGVQAHRILWEAHHWNKVWRRLDKPDLVEIEVANSARKSLVPFVAEKR